VPARARSGVAEREMVSVREPVSAVRCCCIVVGVWEGRRKDRKVEVVCKDRVVIVAVVEAVRPAERGWLARVVGVINYPAPALFLMTCLIMR
jgi:hypothetical protein